MMIVDLVDEVDFKTRLLALGAPVADISDLTAVVEPVKKWLKENPEKESELQAMLEALQSSEVTLLPEVSELVRQLQDN